MSVNPLSKIANTKYGKAVVGQFDKMATWADAHPALTAVIALVALPIIGTFIGYYMGGGASLLGLAIGAGVSVIVFAYFMDSAFASKYGNQAWFKQAHKIMVLAGKILLPLAIGTLGAVLIAQGPASMSFYMGAMMVAPMSIFFLGDTTIPAIADCYKKPPAVAKRRLSPSSSPKHF